jgi:hypothetical protein
MGRCEFEAYPAVAIPVEHDPKISGSIFDTAAHALVALVDHEMTVIVEK